MEEDLRPRPLGPVSPTASRHRHAGLGFFVPHRLASRQIQFYLVSLHKAESHSVSMHRRRRVIGCDDQASGGAGRESHGRRECLVRRGV
jgi:hypothetical protein